MPSSLRANRMLMALLVTALFINVMLWWFTTLFPSGNTPLLLRFSVGAGVDLFGSRTTLMTLPAVGFAILVVNSAFALLLSRRDRTLALLSLGTALLLEIFLGLAMLILFLVNRS